MGMPMDGGAKTAGSNGMDGGKSMLDFLHANLSYILSGISVGGQYALIAIGYTMVYGILRLINFAHGECSCARDS